MCVRLNRGFDCFLQCRPLRRLVLFRGELAGRCGLATVLRCRSGLRPLTGVPTILLLTVTQVAFATAVTLGQFFADSTNVIDNTGRSWTVGPPRSANLLAISVH